MKVSQKAKEHQGVITDTHLRKFKSALRLYGLVDDDGHIIVHPLYNEIRDTGCAGREWHLRNGNKWGAVNERGEWMFDVEYDVIQACPGGGHFLKKDNKMGYCDTKGMLRINFLYDELRNYNYFLDMAEARLNRKWGVLNGGGELVVPIEYDAVAIYDNRLIKISKGNKWGMLDAMGMLVLPIEYESIYIDAPNVFRVKKNGLFGLIDKEKNILFPFKYRDLGAFDQDGITYAKDENGLYGYINRKDQLIVPFKFKRASDFVGYYAEVNNGQNMKGLIDKKGNVVIPLEHKDIYPGKFDETLELKKDNNQQQGFLYGLFDLRNGCILPCIYKQVDVERRDGNGFVECKCWKEDDDYYMYMPEWPECPCPDYPVLVKVNSKFITDKPNDALNINHDEFMDELVKCFREDQGEFGSKREYPYNIPYKLISDNIKRYPNEVSYVGDEQCHCGGALIRLYFEDTRDEEEFFQWQQYRRLCGRLVICKECKDWHSFSN